MQGNASVHHGRNKKAEYPTLALTSYHTLHLQAMTMINRGANNRHMKTAIQFVFLLLS
jgi:hypothetical protein